MARVVVPGLPHHVTQRGARKQRTFLLESDYHAYIEILAKAQAELGMQTWAYCLMPNHVHLIVVPKNRDGLARVFRKAHRTYAALVNSREGWQGHLWQERFRSYVMNEEHLLSAVRYVEMNPVRAGLCQHPGGWPWSSYHAHVAGTDDNLVSVRAMLERIVDWDRFLSLNESDDRLSEIRSHTSSGRPVGLGGHYR
jgi:putative transposase